MLEIPFGFVIVPCSICDMARAGIFISIKDVMTITGLSQPTCWRLMKTMKDVFKKEKHQHVTIHEFCQYEGLSVEIVEEKLKR